MSIPNEGVLQSGEQADPLSEAAGAELAPLPDELPGSDQSVETAVRTRLSEALGTVAESADPVAGLEAAAQEVAQELSHHAEADKDRGRADAGEEIGRAIETLVSVALEADDPVSALEEGADSLAQALAARDDAAEQWHQAAQEQEIELEGAYRHARLHRVTELMDVGYSLDLAVAITNANEADVRARAIAAGRNPMEPIYEYAVLNGYRGVEPDRSTGEAHGRPSRPSPVKDADRSVSAVQALARLSDQAFAEATKGDRWEALMRR